MYNRIKSFKRGFKTYVEEMAHVWPVSKNWSTDIDLDADRIEFVAICSENLHNLNNLFELYESEKEFEKDAKHRTKKIDNGTIFGSYVDSPNFYIVKPGAKIRGVEIQKDDIFVKGLQYWNHGLPSGIGMKGNFEDFISFMEDEFGVKPDDTPTPELYETK